MKSFLQEILCCPKCSGQYDVQPDRMVCMSCQHDVHLINDIPMFSDIQSDMKPSEKRMRGPNQDTPWRRANTRFLHDELLGIPNNALVMDIGAGRGEFADLFASQRYFAVDLYPYPEIDVVCDFSLMNPIVKNSLDVILLMNVLEHLPQAARLINAIMDMLRFDGLILMTVPFLVKIHQAPNDFSRYTHFYIQNMCQEYDLDIVRIEGYYDPAFLLEESERYIRYWGLSRYSFLRRQLIKILLIGLRFHHAVLSRYLGKGYVVNMANEINPAPVGYQVVLKKAKQRQ